MIAPKKELIAFVRRMRKQTRSAKARRLATVDVKLDDLETLVMAAEALLECHAMLVRRPQSLHDALARSVEVGR